VPDDASCARVFAWKGSLISVAWSPDGKVIACGSQDNSVHFWRLSTGNDSEMSGYPSKPRALSWDAKSSLLATSGGEEVCVWDFAGKGPEGLPPPAAQGARRHRAGTLLLAPPRNARLRRRRRRSAALGAPQLHRALPRRAMLDSPASVLAWHPTEHRLAVACADGAVALFSLT
jgi:WD40 repeat protein